MLVIALAATLVIALAATLVATAAATAKPLVTVDVKLERGPTSAVVTGRVIWDGGAARQAPDHMTVGDLRLVAVSDDGHRPTLLANATYDRIATAPTQPVEMRVRAQDLNAIRPGNRVVLTASQHGVISQGARTRRTFVTVGQLQRFGTPQDRIGRRDCSDLPIVPGAELSRCDLVGAYLNRALVSERQDKKATRMLLADLTGATLVGADLTGLSVAGGRLNGADATDAVLDNVSLAGAHATGLVAVNATSDRHQQAAGANIFDAVLTDANFRGAVLNGVSLNHSRLDGANFGGATWTAVVADTASFRGANLQGLKGFGSRVYFADFTDAKLKGAALSSKDLDWATLCRTEMPGGERSDRDCSVGSDPGPAPAANPFVVVSATLVRQPGRAEIHAVIRWNAAAIGTGMSAGDVRAVAIDGATGLPTEVAPSLSIPRALPTMTTFDRVITEPTLAALKPGNRVVLTATQHPPLPSRPGEHTTRSFVTVSTLQAGPRRGRVGSRDCSNIALSPISPGPSGYDLCYLPGAVLTQAALSGPIHEANLTGADMARAGLNGITFDGSAMGGVVATGADFGGVSMLAAFAPRLAMPTTLIRGGQLRAENLDNADFHGSTISDTTFATASLHAAIFSDATFDKVDLGFTGLAKANLERVKAASSAPQRDRRNSLFLSDLTGANLRGSRWSTDEAGELPWEWATLCGTTMPAGTTISGDRDCPR